jgi:hypothetical protein
MESLPCESELAMTAALLRDSPLFRLFGLDP